MPKRKVCMSKTFTKLGEGLDEEGTEGAVLKDWSLHTA
jgi:hypothetical protein